MRKKIAKIINETHCGVCNFDEATGDVFKHCDRCCRKIVTLISALVFGEDEDERND